MASTQIIKRYTLEMSAEEAQAVLTLIENERTKEQTLRPALQSVYVALLNPGLQEHEQ